MNYLKYDIGETDHGKEVLAILRGSLGLSTRKIRSVKWDPAGILLNGQRVTVRHKVCRGQTLSVLKNDSEKKQRKILPCFMDLDILYEDDDLLFVDKPAGIVSHPSTGHRHDSLANGIQAYFDEKNDRSSIHLLGRLDKDTSGVLGIAKNSVAARIMIREQRVHKEYIAVAEGQMPLDQGTIDIPMAEYRDPADHLLKMRPVNASDDVPGGAGGIKQAITGYEVISRSDEYSICRVRTGTGRMHQIRFHMAQIGHPLLGDSLYGHGRTEAMTRSALHACRVSFDHPFSDKKITVEAKLPADISRFF